MLDRNRVDGHAHLSLIFIFTLIKYITFDGNNVSYLGIPISGKKKCFGRCIGLIQSMEKSQRPWLDGKENVCPMVPRFNL